MKCVDGISSAPQFCIPGPPTSSAYLHPYIITDIPVLRPILLMLESRSPTEYIQMGHTTQYIIGINPTSIIPAQMSASSISLLLKYPHLLPFLSGYREGRTPPPP
jgi:hypothetical protein